MKRPGKWSNRSGKVVKPFGQESGQTVRPAQGDKEILAHYRLALDIIHFFKQCPSAHSIHALVGLLLNEELGGELGQY